MTKEILTEKWAEELKEDAAAPADSQAHKQKTTAQLLENQDHFLAEASNVVAGVENWDPILMKLVRRMAPKLIAYDLCGVQAMTGPTGLMFALKARYAGRNGTTPGTGSGSGETPQGGAEALGLDEARTNYSGTGTHAGTNPWAAGYQTGTGKSTAAGETDAWAAMGVTIEKSSIAAVTRQLRADYSLELAQDMKAIHGLDADTELVNILSTELIAELNREVVRTIYGISKQGAQFATTPGTYDMQNDADGRWAAERYKGLLFAIERDANVIATETRRGKGNLLIVSADVASALVMAGILDYNPAVQGMTGNLQVDVTGTSYAGQAGRFKVFVDPYATGNGYVVGFKGMNQYDAGMFYCPYVPLQLVRAVDPTNFHPALGFKTRYALAANPFTTLGAGQNVYYRKAEIINLI
ncbi:major head protein [Acidovorax phage ACP17]|uniref:Major capsid protein n=1 Tax=Acidovorax phage ACP17 TaxID=2010329 RepID=A0A218M2U8_9CAUD|nr:major head protein [Acidovorax phage ACP17]ASD50378.1 major capsid protein [Acidovorax phage ACP17]